MHAWGGQKTEGEQFVPQENDILHLHSVLVLSK